MRPRDIVKTKYLFFCKSCRQQVWQCSDLWWEKRTHNVRWPSDHVLSWGHVTNIVSSTWSMATKHDWLVNYDKRNPPMESHETLIMYPFVVTWLTKRVVSPLLQSLWLPNLAGWWFIVRWKWIFPVSTLPHEATWQTKKKLFLLLEDVCSSNLKGFDIWWGKPHKEVARLSDHVIRRVHASY